MILIRRYCLRFTSLICGLVLLSACEQKNVIPTPPVPTPVLTPAQAQTVNRTTADTIVINLDLTQKKAPKPALQLIPIKKPEPTPVLISIQKPELAPILIPIQQSVPVPVPVPVLKPIQKPEPAPVLISIQKNTVSTDTTDPDLATLYNVITETKQPPISALNSQINQDLITLLAATPETVSTELPAPVGEGIIEKSDVDQALLLTPITEPQTTPKHIAKVSAHPPKRIALAMPLHGKLGKAGQAVVDGFMAARFESKVDSAVIPYIKVYDTTELSSLDALYLQASADSMEMVIGPLDKDRVIELSQKNALTIPTLALNYIPIGSNYSSTANLIQFGLAVEDEASQLARRSLEAGHKRIIILHQDQPWAIRAAQYFSSSWIELGGEIAGQVSFSGDGDHSKTITQALLINQSHERVKILKTHLAGSGNRIKFEPRRRQDVDAIILFALPTDGRQIIPTLAFHYAADLPVYASHHIYQGPTNTTRDRDLEKVIFTELPWLIEQPSIQQQISQQWPDRERYTRLFAIGVDAYRLFPRLEQLQNLTGSSVDGVTGVLQMNSQGRIVTHSSWGQFRAGKVVVDPK